MPVLRSRPRRGQSRARRVDRLPLVAQIHATCHLTDQDWRQALISQLLVHTEEVDLGHLNSSTIEDHRDGDGCDESAKTATATHTDNPFWIEVGRVECPPQELDGVIKAELALSVLHVVICQQGVDFVSIMVVLEVD